MNRYALACTLALVGSGAAIAQQTPATSYRYFDSVVEVGVDPTMVAVFVDPATPSAPVERTIKEAGVAFDAVYASGVPGWSYVELPLERASVNEAARVVDVLADDEDIDFISPVHIGSGGLPWIPTRDLLVRFNAGTTQAEMEAILAAAGIETILEHDASGMSRLVRARTTTRRAREVLSLAATLSDEPSVEFAQTDGIYWAERYFVPNDPLFPQQWALNQANDQDMDAPEAWDLSTGDSSIVVVILDSGIDQGHSDINQIGGQDFTGGGSAGGGPNGDCDNHGTAVAGCVSATINNSTGVVGIAPDCRVRSGKIFNELWFLFCLPVLESQDSWTVAGINWASTGGARVTNSSWGGGTASAAITTAFNNTEAAGVIHFAASGNDGTSTIGFPANLSSVNAVGALASTGARASFSTYGSGLFISAPGAAILTTDRMGSAGYAGGNTTTIDGTSFASPYAAGVAALVLSADPSLTPNEVESVLASTAVDRGTAGYDLVYGWGFINAFRALGAVTTNCPADVNGSGMVDFDDLVSVLAQWGPCAGCDGDVDESGEVDFDDLVIVLAQWGPC